MAVIRSNHHYHWWEQHCFSIVYHFVGSFNVSILRAAHPKYESVEWQTSKWMLQKISSNAVGQQPNTTGTIHIHNIKLKSQDVLFNKHLLLQADDEHETQASWNFRCSRIWRLFLYYCVNWSLVFENIWTGKTHFLNYPDMRCALQSVWLSLFDHSCFSWKQVAAHQVHLLWSCIRLIRFLLPHKHLAVVSTCTECPLTPVKYLPDILLLIPVHFWR